MCHITQRDCYQHRCHCLRRRQCFLGLKWVLLRGAQKRSGLCTNEIDRAARAFTTTTTVSGKDSVESRDFVAEEREEIGVSCGKRVKIRRRRRRKK